MAACAIILVIMPSVKKEETLDVCMCVCVSTGDGVGSEIEIVPPLAGGGKLKEATHSDGLHRVFIVVSLWILD